MSAAPQRRIADRLRAERRAGFVGRAAELDHLAAVARGDGPVVTFVLGIGGIGKTSLLDALGERLGGDGVAWRRLDCEGVAPTPAGLLTALGSSIGASEATVDAVTVALTAMGRRVVLALDQYERLHLLDAWLRQELVPALPASVRLLLVGRHAPVEAWTGAPGWGGLVQALRLGPLAEAEARAWLAHQPLGAAARERVLRLCAGHPLALLLAARSALERDGGASRGDGLPPDAERRPIVEVLAPLFLRDVPDPTDRRLLEAACLVRRATRSTLAAMAGEGVTAEAFDAAFERLRALPFVAGEADGLTVHETVRTAIAASLEALDPVRHGDLRARAWRCLRRELAAARPAHLWRYTADTLYLVDRPLLRETFFPREPPPLVVERARPGDDAAILDLLAASDAADVPCLRRWWEAVPRAFHVVRDAPDGVAAFYAIARADALPAGLRREDPIAAAWWRHAEDPALGVARGAPVLFVRRMVVRQGGDGSAALRAACWLDAKRAYFEHPDAQRLYVADRRAELEVLGAVGFVEVPALAVARQDGPALATLLLEFGDGGVLGWMTRLVDAQFAGVAPAGGAGWALDAQARNLRVEGRPVPLTRLEFGVLQHLSSHPGRVIGREELLREVWGQQFGGSNVVDGVVRSLRKKLGVHGGAIETVIGHGYRLGSRGAAT